MWTERSYYLGTLILGVAAALASCLLALALSAQPAQATSQPGDLSVSQTATPDPLESGNLTYTLTVKHEQVDGCSYGCYYLDDIRVTDNLPSGVDVVAVNPSSSNVSCTITSNVTCTKSYLYDGSSFNVDIVVRPTAAGAQTLTNAATVISEDSSYPDLNTANNSFTATTQVSDAYVPASDTTAPETTLTEKPYAFSSNVSPKFSFSSSEGPPTFECKLDGGAFESCVSPKQLFLLPEGQHTFQVRAKDSSGNVDPTPAEHTWTVDSISPKITFTERPSEVTNDRTPSWAWTVEEVNPGTYDECYVYDYTNDRGIFEQSDCASPLDFEAELPDGDYRFSIDLNDKAGNYGYKSSYFEVDTLAPKVISVKPTGRRVAQWAYVKVTFDDNVYGSAQFVKIFKRGSTTPLAVEREYAYEDGEKYIDISPKNYLRRDTWYTVKVGTGVNDGANNLEAPKTWSFKTK